MTVYVILTYKNEITLFIYFITILLHLLLALLHFTQLLYNCSSRELEGLFVLEGIWKYSMMGVSTSFSIYRI